jgi:PAS domain S-box-containing protein
MTPRRLRVLVLILTGGLALGLTLAAWRAARDGAESEARNRFDVRAAEFVLAIRGRMLDYEQVLRGAAGLLAASQSVAADEWRDYVATIQIERAYPGIVGIGHVSWDDGGDRPVAKVDYIEPLDDANRRAVGFDMAAEPARRRAMERARDSGEAAITRALTLVQDAAEPRPSGFLMFLPVFRRGAVTETVIARRATLAGFIYAPFRFADLIAGSIGAAPGFDLRLLDVSQDAAPVELYRSVASAALGEDPRFSRIDTFRVGQRVWRLEAASLPAFEQEVASGRPALILASGLAITALLLIVVWSLATTRERARELAQHMTVALRASDERLQLALASSHLALFDWDVPAGLVQLSAEWSVMLGGPPEPTLAPARKLELLVHPDEAHAVMAEIRSLLRGDTDEYRVEHRVRTLQGGWKWIESSARVNERDKEGRALRVTGANADITERKAVEELKNEFIATVSHELRTPLTSMLGSLALMNEGAAGDLPPEARKFTEIAYANTERLADLVNDILDIERIEAGGVELSLRAVPLGELLERAFELNAGYAERFGARFELELAPKGLSVRADRDRLMQVLTNLLSNAAKHSPRGAAVTVKVEERGAAARLSVIDRGPGIAAEFRARLFGKFEQADRSRGGTGLGLAISKALIERMDGRIGCESEPGRGSTFWIELPRA